MKKIAADAAEAEVNLAKSAAAKQQDLRLRPIPTTRFSRLPAWVLITFLTVALTIASTTLRNMANSRTCTRTRVVGLIRCRPRARAVVQVLGRGK